LTGAAQFTASIEADVLVDSMEGSQFISISRPDPVINTPQPAPASDAPTGNDVSAVEQTVSTVEFSSSESLQENIDIKVDVHIDNSFNTDEYNPTRPDVGPEVRNPVAIPTSAVVEDSHERYENIASSEDIIKPTCSSSAGHVGGSHGDIAESTSEESDAMNFNQSTGNTPQSSNALPDGSAGGSVDSFIVVDASASCGASMPICDAIQTTTATTSGQIRNVTSTTIQSITMGSDIRLEDTNAGEAMGTKLSQSIIRDPDDVMVEQPTGAAMGHLSVTLDDQRASPSIAQPVPKEQPSVIAQHNLLGRLDVDIPDRDGGAIQEDTKMAKSSDLRSIRELERASELSLQTQTPHIDIDTLDVVEDHHSHGSVSVPIDNNEVVSESRVDISPSEQGRDSSQHGLTNFNESRDQLSSTGASITFMQTEYQTRSEERFFDSSQAQGMFPKSSLYI
jgi:hypothetical protein